MDRLKSRAGCYDPAVLSGLARLLERPAAMVVEAMPVSGVAPGMLMAEDLYTDAGVILLRKGVSITEPIKLRLERLADEGTIPSTVSVLVPSRAGAAGPAA